MQFLGRLREALSGSKSRHPRMPPEVTLTSAQATPAATLLAEGDERIPLVQAAAARDPESWGLILSAVVRDDAPFAEYLLGRAIERAGEAAASAAWADPSVRLTLVTRLRAALGDGSGNGLAALADLYAQTTNEVEILCGPPLSPMIERARRILAMLAEAAERGVVRQDMEQVRERAAEVVAAVEVLEELFARRQEAVLVALGGWRLGEISQAPALEPTEGAIARLQAAADALKDATR